MTRRMQAEVLERPRSRKPDTHSQQPKTPSVFSTGAAKLHRLNDGTQVHRREQMHSGLFDLWRSILSCKKYTGRFVLGHLANRVDGASKLSSGIREGA
jgi:hypothetical protein